MTATATNTPVVTATPTATPSAGTHEVLFSENFSTGTFDTNVWNTYYRNIAGFGNTLIITTTTTGFAAKMTGSHKTGFLAKQAFSRGQNLRATFKCWIYYNHASGMYAPWQSRNTLDIATDEYDGIRYLCGGLMGMTYWAQPEVSDFVMGWGENNPGPGQWGGSQSGPAIDNAFQDAFIASATDQQGVIADSVKISIRILLGDTAGGLGQWSVNGSAWTSFKDVALGQVMDTRTYPVNANVNGEGAAKTPAWGPARNNHNAPAFELVNGVTPVYLGFCMGDNDDNIWISDIVVERGDEGGPAVTGVENWAAY